MIKIEGLKKNYEKFSLDCSLAVRPGYITGLIGQNGAGKSTVFKIMLGLVRSDGGTVKILGKDASELEPEDRENIGVVLADSGFSGYFTVKDVAIILSKMYSCFDREYFYAKIREFGLPEDKKIKEFSTGMKAKLKMIVAISHKARLLVLDEPTAGLDVVARDELLNMLREFMEEDEERAILISSHISGDLEGLCDDVYMIHEGKIVLHEDMDVILSEYAVIKADEEQYEKLDRQHIIRTEKENYGYSLLTDQKQYYAENWPELVIEKGSIDNVITMMIRGKR